MKCNVGITEQIVRIVIGVAIVFIVRIRGIVQENFELNLKRTREA